LQNEAYGGPGGANNPGAAANLGGGAGLGSGNPDVNDVSDAVPQTVERLVGDTPPVRNPFASSKWRDDARGVPHRRPQNTAANALGFNEDDAEIARAMERHM